MQDNNVENLSIETEEQADAVLEAIERPSHDQIQETQPQTQPMTQDEWELTVGGKPIKAKREQVMQWAQQGYTAPGKISALTKELESMKQRWAETEPKWKEAESKYGPIDEYVRQNPDFWDHVVQAYQQRQQGLQDPSNPLAPVVNDLRTQLQDLIQFKNQMMEERQKTQVQQQDQAYLSTLSEVKKIYPDIDFDTPDEEGKSLEYRVLEYGVKEGIQNFKTAFRDYYHDELVKRAEAKAKENLVKSKQKQTQLGILGIAPQPSRRAQPDLSKMSYDQIAEMAKEELGIR